MKITSCKCCSPHSKILISTLLSNYSNKLKSNHKFKCLKDENMFDFQNEDNVSA